jgi:hypothetical protein
MDVQRHRTNVLQIVVSQDRRFNADPESRILHAKFFPQMRHTMTHFNCYEFVTGIRIALFKVAQYEKNNFGSMVPNNTRKCILTPSDRI